MIRNGNIERNYPSHDNGTAEGVCPDHKLRYEFASQFTVDKEVLDAAMGCGYASTLLRTEKYTGIDVADEAVEYALKYYTGNFFKADLNNPLEEHPSGWNTKHYDYGVSFETIEHLSNIPAYLQFLNNNCDNVIISSPIKSESGGLHSPYHTQEWGWKEFLDLVDPFLLDGRERKVFWEFDDGAPYIEEIYNPDTYQTGSGVIIVCYFKKE